MIDSEVLRLSSEVESESLSSKKQTPPRESALARKKVQLWVLQLVEQYKRRTNQWNCHKHTHCVEAEESRQYPLRIQRAAPTANGGQPTTPQGLFGPIYHKF
mmetsp:Transcript_21063/g.31250  ORF Transcript_21063/g.31250 Transcript_21063/m.31250 type:complete len:102 (+) Transcript_21063:10-315(+)